LGRRVRQPAWRVPDSRDTRAHPCRHRSDVGHEFSLRLQPGWSEALIKYRDLLTESGSIFVQIGDESVHLVRSLLDEVFGSENCVSLAPAATAGGPISLARARGRDR
ncbi:MAG: hypothetical protein J0I06_18345, partial [Planctomycetes bacterium]|nr:hypothetical protein [Planctomycetota bacterium]